MSGVGVWHSCGRIGMDCGDTRSCGDRIGRFDSMGPIDRLGCSVSMGRGDSMGPPGPETPRASADSWARTTPMGSGDRMGRGDLMGCGGPTGVGDLVVRRFLAAMPSNPLAPATRSAAATVPFAARRARYPLVSCEPLLVLPQAGTPGELVPSGRYRHRCLDAANMHAGLAHSGIRSMAATVALLEHFSSIILAPPKVL